MIDKVKKGNFVFINRGERGRREVREGAADFSKGDFRFRGVYMLGGGERIGVIYKSIFVEVVLDFRG